MLFAHFGIDRDDRFFAATDLHGDVGLHKRIGDLGQGAVDAIAATTFGTLQRFF